MKYLFYVFILVIISVSVSYSQVAVIANKSVPVSKISSGALLQIYLMKNTKWSDGTKIVVYYNKEQSICDKVCEYIGMDIINLRKRWMQMQLSGEGKAPVAIDGDNEMIKKVKSTEGAIGYVNISSVKGKDLNVIATIE
ncbi:MAG: substrate-binding domain-containing protein [Bacteroidetes bacterium]|nr:substrate-binding domain-containing protein [Bacteroidota bacterium]